MGNSDNNACNKSGIVNSADSEVNKRSRSIRSVSRMSNIENGLYNDTHLLKMSKRRTKAKSLERIGVSAKVKTRGGTTSKKRKDLDEFSDSNNMLLSVEDPKSVVSNSNDLILENKHLGQSDVSKCIKDAKDKTNKKCQFLKNKGRSKTSNSAKIVQKERQDISDLNKIRYGIIEDNLDNTDKLSKQEHLPKKRGRPRKTNVQVVEEKREETLNLKSCKYGNLKENIVTEDMIEGDCLPRSRRKPKRSIDEQVPEEIKIEVPKPISECRTRNCKQLHNTDLQNNFLMLKNRQPRPLNLVSKYKNRNFSDYNASRKGIKVTEMGNKDDSNVGTEEETADDISTQNRRKYKRKRKRGRPKKGEVYEDDDFVVEKRQKIKIDKETVAKKKMNANEVILVQCGKCKAEMQKHEWYKHNLMEHNALSWLEGSEVPDYQNDERLLRKVLFANIKKRRNVLTCEFCKTDKGSVLGFISHITFCGKSAQETQALMYTCPICRAVMKPSSSDVHKRTHEKESKRESELTIDLINSERVKRKAAERAVSKISEFTLEDTSKSETKQALAKKAKSVIIKPQKTKRIPGILKVLWQKAIEKGNEAACNLPGCKFSCKNVEEMLEHYGLCNFIPKENYTCKICNFETKDEQKILDHARKNHSNEIQDHTDNVRLLSESESSSSSFSGNDSADEKRPRKEYVSKKSSKDSSSELKFDFVKRGRIFHETWNKPYTPAVCWTLEFEKDNYSTKLFPDYNPNEFILLNGNESKAYVPELDESMLVQMSKNGSNWKKWKRFESGFINDMPTCFLGGPIWASAWLPVPSSLVSNKNVSQFIAVSTHQTMDVEYSIGQLYTGKNIIQIWELGFLDYSNINKNVPKLAYAISHSAGTVWSLEWCPSGCYEDSDDKNTEKPRQMGLLAAGCSDGCIYIYSLIFPENLPSISLSSDSEIIYPVYKTDPVMILVVNTIMYDNKEQNWQVTKISWTKEKHHKMIVAGLSNGYIALWNIASESTLLKHQRSKTVFLNSCKHFYAHSHAVTMVYLVPSDNSRYLASGSYDRTYKFWDLEDISSPRLVTTKSLVTDGTWMNNWASAVVAYDDALSFNHTYSYVLPIREFNYKQYNILPLNSPSFTIDSSDFGNCIAQGSAVGDILAIFPQQLLYAGEMTKALNRKRITCIASSVEFVDLYNIKWDKNKAKKNENHQQYIPETYKDCKDRIGLIFRDSLNNFKAQQLKPNKERPKRTMTCEMMKFSPLEQYPFASANKVSWNPNVCSFLWLAVGYQNGFLRFIPFKSMANTIEMKKK